MGLRTTIQNSLVAAFNNELSDAVKTFTITRFSTVSYNSNTLSNSNSSVVVGSGRGVFDKYRAESYLDNIAKPIDTVIICLLNELAVTPQIDDYITDSDGIDYKVVNFRKDPANVSINIGCMTSYGSI